MKIVDVIESLFPSGYPYYDSSKVVTGNFVPGTFPYFCTDLFAIAGVLLQRSGAYHHVVPENDRVSVVRTITVDKAKSAEWGKLGKMWRGDEESRPPPPPLDLVNLWNMLWSLRGSDVYSILREDESAPKWWEIAVALFCIADEAGEGFGFSPEIGKNGSYQARFLKIRSPSGFERFTFSNGQPDIVCVVPKSRTPALGCTLRSLSQHLALMPPRGLARAYWLPYQGPEAKLWSLRSLNCLVVPLPYQISASAFKEVRKDGERWGWFHLEPHWCDGSDKKDSEGFNGKLDEFWTFISSLIEAAERDVGEINVLVFPEVALSAVVFREVAQRLKSTNVELLVSGTFDYVSEGGKGFRRGNFAAMAAIGGFVSFREKHHRWRLDRTQIERYGLGSSLDPDFGWWEELDILSRSLDVYVLRGTSTVTTLICEDLARNDPCQELVRGIGPNIVFALLMDGAQLKDRWPARYATVLAEDPGSSVLCLTSLGLIERCNAARQLSHCRNIGLWRDDKGGISELCLGEGYQALCLSLRASPFKGYTLDGRSDDTTSESWRLVGIQPVRVANAKNRFPDILEGQWPAGKK